MPPMKLKEKMWDEATAAVADRTTEDNPNEDLWRCRQLERLKYLFSGIGEKGAKELLAVLGLCINDEYRHVKRSKELTEYKQTIEFFEKHPELLVKDEDTVPV